MSTEQIGVESDGGIRVLVLRGEHDLSTAPDVRAHMEDAVRGEGDLVVDLCEAGFIDSSILGVLIAGYRGLAGAEQPRGFAFAAVPGSTVTRLFDLVSVSDLIPVYPTRAAAVAALGGTSPR